MNKEESAQWKDDATDTYIQPMAQFLVNHVPDDFVKIELVADFDTGAQGCSAVYFPPHGKRVAIKDFFTISDELDTYLKSFHDEYVKHDENWVAMLLTISPDGDFDIQFEYTDPYKWDDRWNT